MDNMTEKMQVMTSALRKVTLGVPAIVMPNFALAMESLRSKVLEPSPWAVRLCNDSRQGILYCPLKMKPLAVIVPANPTSDELIVRSVASPNEMGLLNVVMGLVKQSGWSSNLIHKQ